MKFIFEQILDFLFPSSCRLCGKEGPIICKECEKNLKFQANISTLNNINVLSFFEYHKNNPLAKGIKSGKYQHSEALFPFLSKKIIPLIPTSFKLENAIFVPVPLHWIRKNERGYNQSEKIANTLQKAFPQSVVSSLVKRIRNTPQQAKLSKKERKENMYQAFEINKKESLKYTLNNHIVIIDDIVTTGSTIQEIVFILQQSGFTNISALTLGKAIH